MTSKRTKLKKLISNMVKKIIREETIKEHIITKGKEVSLEEMTKFLRALGSLLPTDTFQQWGLQDGSYAGILTNSPEELADAIEKYATEDPDAKYVMSVVFLRKFDGMYSREAHNNENELTDNMANLNLEGASSNPLFEYIEKVSVIARSPKASETGRRMANDIYPNRRW